MSIEVQPPRPPRPADGDAYRDAGPVALATACLDPTFPLEDLTRQAAQITQEHFASPRTRRRRMLLYAPLYLSSRCINYCVYCGFRHAHRIERRHLDADEALCQAEILRARGLRHVLLVAGDFPSLTTTDYFAEVIHRLSDRGIRSAVEIAPQTTASYATLATAGACGVTLYQETYNRELYALYHPRGTKASYDWRLEGLRRAAEGAVKRLGLGILLGLGDPCEELLAMIRHAGRLRSRFADCTLAFSLPRIHDAPEGFVPPYPAGDDTFIRLYCALRVAFPRAELVLSTREPALLRNRLARICITQMSAGSSTVPGGYEDGGVTRPGGEQFPVADHRSPAEVAQWLRAEGFEPAWEIQ